MTKYKDKSLLERGQILRDDCAAMNRPPPNAVALLDELLRELKQLQDRVTSLEEEVANLEWGDYGIS